MPVQPWHNVYTLNPKIKGLKKNFLFLLLFSSKSLFSQKVDSIYFHLYTDSLKKGVHNYINVDGKMSTGKWWPLTSKDLNFTTTEGKFEGSNLIIPWEFTGASVTVTATLKSNPVLTKSITIWMKILPDPDILPTADEIMNRKPPKDSTKNKTKSKNKN